MDQDNIGCRPTSPINYFVEAIDYDLRFPTWSMEYLKKAAVEQRLVRPRSLAWAVLLNAVPPPSGDILLSIKGHRGFYNELRDNLSMDPRAVIGDDPLSQSDESVWKQHFCDNELKALILQDVVRTFPDEVYFRSKGVQDLMVRVLFFWARSHPNPGYRQGMHEILAPLLFELHSDRTFAPSTLSETLRYYLEERYLEHDSYMLFDATMKGLKKFYSTGEVVPTSSGRLPTSKAVHAQNEVVRYLETIKEEYLLQLDPELTIHLDECGISMELFGIRWLRLLFGREFPRSEIPHLWSFLFSDGPMLPNIHYVILAMLISLRTVLLESDTGAALSLLMRPSLVSASHVRALALHLRSPKLHPRPAPPPLVKQESESSSSSPWSGPRPEEGTEWSGSEGEAGVCEGLAEGADVARALGTLALVRARLPAAADALRRALPNPSPAVEAPLRQITQLAALLQCRNHSLIDVETALEAAENQSTDGVGQRQIVPVKIMTKFKDNNRTKFANPVKPVTPVKPVRRVKEVPLTLFHVVECKSAGDLPFQDPLRLRTE